MRKVLGAFLLVAALVVPSAHDYLRELMRPPAVVSKPSPPPDTAAPARLAAIPADYRDAPLAFLSRAPSDSLQLLSGIGPVLAERIANARTGRSLFTRWDDLLAVKGIGPKKLERLRRMAEKADER